MVFQVQYGFFVLVLAQPLLLPSMIENSQQRKIYYFQIQLLISVVIAMMIVFGWHVVLQRNINLSRKKINNLQSQLAIVTKQVASNKKLIQQQQRLQQVGGQMTNLVRQQNIISQGLKALHQGGMASLYITQLLIGNNEMRITGKTKTMADLAGLINKINHAYPAAKYAVIQKITKQDDDYNFTLVWAYRRR